MDLRKLPNVFLCTVTACGATYASSDDALVRQLHDADQALLVAVHTVGVSKEGGNGERAARTASRQEATPAMLATRPMAVSGTRMSAPSPLTCASSGLS
jgi:hypothetical protein